MSAADGVCAQCAGGDETLAKYVKAKGSYLVCSFCSKRRRAITLEKLAELVNTIVRRHAAPGEEIPQLDAQTETVSFELEGSSPTEMIHEILGDVVPGLAEALLEELRGMTWRDVKNGGNDYYADESAWNLGVVIPPKYKSEWDDFVEQVKHQGRFFNEEAKAYLESLFKPLLAGVLHDGKPPFLRIGGNDDSIRYVFRARQANTEEERRRILANPARELAPPPPRQRPAGRMNAAGIRTFYGCTDIETAVAEARAPVGGAVLVGKFEFVAPVEILDLRLLDRSRGRFSFFDPDIEQKVAYLDFMRQLHDIIRAPVLPGAETLDYLPTQMIAEFLATKGLSGLSSLLCTGESKRGLWKGRKRGLVPGLIDCRRGFGAH